MTLEIFLWGFLGGLIFQFMNYLEYVRNSQNQENDSKLYKKSNIDRTSLDFDDKDADIHEFKMIYKKIQESKSKNTKKISGKKVIFFYTFYASIGGAMAFFISPSFPFFAFIIGIFSSSFISKFQKVQ